MQATRPSGALQPLHHAIVAGVLTLACIVPGRAAARADLPVNPAPVSATKLEASPSSPDPNSETAATASPDGAPPAAPSEPPRASGSRTNPPLVLVKVLSEGGPDIAAQRAYVSAGTNKFAFLVPSGFRLDSSQDNCTVMHSEDYSSTLTLRMVDPLLISGQELGPALGTKLILREHPNAAFLQNFSLSAANRAGPALDFHWLELGALKYGRAVFIPWKDYVLEFALATDTDQFVANQRLLNTLLLTFRAADAAGRLEIAPLSDKL
jgi:hypothetical protein